MQTSHDPMFVPVPFKHYIIILIWIKLVSHLITTLRYKQPTLWVTVSPLHCRNVSCLLQCLIWGDNGLVKKYRGGGEPEDFKMWWLETQNQPLPFGTKLSDPPLNEGWKSHDPPPIGHDIFGCIIRQNHLLLMKLWCYLRLTFRFIS